MPVIIIEQESPRGVLSGCPSSSNGIGAIAHVPFDPEISIRCSTRRRISKSSKREPDVPSAGYPTAAVIHAMADIHDADLGPIVII